MIFNDIYEQEEEDIEKKGRESIYYPERLKDRWFHRVPNGISFKDQIYTRFLHVRSKILILVAIVLVISLSILTTSTVVEAPKVLNSSASKGTFLDNLAPLLNNAESRLSISPTWGKLGSMKSLSFLNQNSLSCERLRLSIDTSPLPMQDQDVKLDYEIGVGVRNLFQNRSVNQCSTYSDRFDRYTDEALGITYRTLPEEKRLQMGYDSIHRILKPESMNKKEWEKELRMLNREVNSRTHINGTALKIPDWQAIILQCGDEVKIRKGGRTAMILRTFHAAVWTEDDVLSTRAFIVEMLASRPEAGWGLHILVQVPDDSGVFTSYEDQIEVLTELMPKEFWPFVHFWSSSSARLLFPGLSGTGDLGGPYTFQRDCLMADQIFVNLLGDSDRYDYIQNWEGDIKFTGDFRILFDALDNFSSREPFDGSLERYSEHYIPGSSKSEIKWNDREDTAISNTPSADLIVLNPVFKLKNSHWAHANDQGKYDVQIPRVASTVSSLRMSLRMVRAYNNATIKHKKSMACEAWPAIVVLHSSLPPSNGQTFVSQEEKDWLGSPLKGVFVPHPLLFQKGKYKLTDYEEQLLDDKPKAKGYDYSFLRGSTYSYDAWFAAEIYRKWMIGNYCQEPLIIHPVKDRFV